MLCLLLLKLCSAGQQLTVGIRDDLDAAVQAQSFHIQHQVVIGRIIDLSARVVQIVLRTALIEKSHIL